MYQRWVGKDSVVYFATSTKKDGSMGITSSRSQIQKRNRERFLKNVFGIHSSCMVAARLVHQNRIVQVNLSHRGKIIPECDGLYTFVSNVALFIYTQDCLPVFLTDQRATFIACLHCGWKNLLAGILPQFIRQLQRKHGIDPETILIRIGPSIKKECYEIGEDLMRRLQYKYLNCLEQQFSRTYLDLHQILRTQASALGVLPQHISEYPDCTYHTKQNGDYKYFSLRRDRIPGRNMGSVIIKRDY